MQVLNGKSVKVAEADLLAHFSSGECSDPWVTWVNDVMRFDASFYQRF